MMNLLSRWTETALTSGVRVLGILLIAVLLIRLLKAVTRRLVQLAGSESRVALMREQQTRTLAGLLYSVGTALILALAALTLLAEFGVNVTPIAAAAGLVSLAVGFGGQHLVRDLINGFFIVFEDQYAVGDTVRIGEVSGRVEHLTLRRTVLRDDKGALITVPNGDVRTISNLGRDWAQIFVDITITQDAEVARALEMLEQAAGEFRSDDAWRATLVDGPRVLGVESLSLAGTVLRTQLRTAPNRQYEAAREFRRRIRAHFERARIGLTSAQQVELVRSEES